MVLDWLLIAVVIATAIGLWFVIQGFIDSLIEYWRAYKEDA